MSETVRKLKSVSDYLAASPKHLTKRWTWERPYELGYYMVPFGVIEDLQRVVLEIERDSETAEFTSLETESFVVKKTASGIIESGGQNSGQVKKAENVQSPNRGADQDT